LGSAKKGDAVRPVPGVLAGVSGHGGQTGLGPYRNTEAEAEVFAMGLDQAHVVLDFRRQMIGGHVRHRLGAEDAVAIELAPVNSICPKRKSSPTVAKGAGTPAIEPTTS
jgi:hypothetical protein